MFNMYTKMATALGAFALLFSTGAWGQCADGEIAVDFTIPVTNYASEVSWQLNDAAGNNLFTGGSAEAGQWCLAPGDYTFIGTDSWGDGWDGQFATFTWNGITTEFTVASNGGGNISFSQAIVLAVSADIPGCTDPAASNYNADATADDGTCCLDNLITINTFDSFGDGWSFGPYSNQWGGIILNGDSLEVPAGNPSFQLCLPEGCYTAQISMGPYGEEASWEAVDASGNVINSGSGFGGGGTTFDADFFFFAGSDACVVAGCNDSDACNYDENSNFNDGSCEYLSCAGCTDPASCNYDDTATLNDGTCDYSCIGCGDELALNYDADATIIDNELCVYCEGVYYDFTIEDTFGDGICCAYGEGSYSVSLAGEVVASGGDFGDSETTLFCSVDADACVVVSLTPDAYSGETSWSLTNAITGEEILSGDGTEGSFGTASCTAGCNDSGACNYDATADIDDGSCDYSCIGCTDSTAANYDPNATVDSGACIYCDPGTFILNVDMADSFGDGWSGSEYYLYDLSSGALVDSGSLATAFTGDGLTAGSDLICLAPGCYNFQVLDDTYPGEVSIDLSDQFGTFYQTAGAGQDYGLDFTLTGQCGFEGCSDTSANNYDPSATVDDGSCLYPPANDDVVNAEPLLCGAPTSGSLLNANDNEGLAGETIGNEFLSASAVWYVINSDSDQAITMSTCDTPLNDPAADTDYAQGSDISIFTQDVDGVLTGVAGSNAGCATGFHSTIIWYASTGVDYFVRVEGTGGNDFVLSATCDPDAPTPPSNDNCDGAIVATSGQTYTSDLCGANSELVLVPTFGQGAAYGVWYTFNTLDYDAIAYTVTNISNEAMGSYYATAGSCAEQDYSGWFGCFGFTGTCGGAPNPVQAANQDLDFIMWTADAEGCGEFEFIITGIYFGCTDATANNYDPIATSDDGSCDFAGVTAANDECSNAIALECNTVVTGSTGGSSSIGAPLNLSGCEASPGAGVWYTFEGDSSLISLSTCGSAIDSKINVYTATEACGGGGVDAPAADACDSLVTTTYSVGGGAWDSEISWDLTNANGDTVLSGGAPSSGDICLEAGDYTLLMGDAFGDGWNGAIATFTDGLGDLMGSATLDTGLSGSAVVTIAPYSTEPIYIAGDFTCAASALSSDGTGACDLFNADDVNLEFISTPGLIYYVYVGASDVDGSPLTDDNGSFDLVFDCATVVPGCMDSAACNYNMDANVSGEECDYFSCVCADETGTPVEFFMNDSYGDGWNGAAYTVADLAGNVVAEGSLDEAATFVDNDNYQGPEFGSDYFCLAPGCYSISVSDGDWASEVSWQALDADGVVLASGGPTDGITISVGGAVCGCTDPGACNYDALATDEDGSCEYESCAGCTDNTACNYDAAAVLDDGSCCFDNCVTVNMVDSFGDGWNGAEYTLSSVDGTVLGTGTIAAGNNGSDSYCLADGCYSISVTEGAWPGEISWNVGGAFGGIVSGAAGESVSFNVGSGDACVVGCDIPTACNYNAATNISDLTLCVFDGCSGCTYESASNYNEGAVIDDGSCDFDIANPCPADLNGDGSVSTADLLEFLTAFGQIC